MTTTTSNAIRKRFEMIFTENEYNRIRLDIVSICIFSILTLETICLCSCGTTFPFCECFIRRYRRERRSVGACEGDWRLKDGNANSLLFIAYAIRRVRHSQFHFTDFVKRIHIIYLIVSCLHNTTHSSNNRMRIHYKFLWFLYRRRRRRRQVAMEKKKYKMIQNTLLLVSKFSFN